ncbi:polysaccharide lyase family 7 protein [Nevskia sp.]|uniref:polysaccharide lyase family 7 protein n=1 Tax=Nevskia sp. TaxID=1929292 RepID=UPI0025CE9BD7|nr:polysaccharide lyase family 7 protein [Nevskia sp.]
MAALAFALLCPIVAQAAPGPQSRQTQVADTEPDPFSFATINNATPGIGYASEPLTVTGITGPSPISVVVGAYKINDGPYVSQSGTVNLNDRVVVLVRSSTRSNKSVAATLTIGGISATFTVNTGDLDTVPDSFSFAPVNDAELGRTYVSAPATISGITERAAIVVTGGRYRINDGAFTSAEGTVSLGDQVYTEVVASSSASTAKTATLTIGGVAGSFTVTTAAGTTLDPVPDSFSFAAINDAVPEAIYVSAPATITGITGPSPISVSGGRYRINAGGFTSDAGTVNAGDQIYAEVVASSLDSTATTATVTVGGVAGAFTVTTAEQTQLDPIPDDFSFAPVNEAVPGATYVSDPATITGITGPSPISVSGGRYRINAGGFTSASGTVNAGDQVYAEAIASSSDSTATTATVTIGGVTASFTVTTAADTVLDPVPDRFSFAPVNEATPGTTYVSVPTTITGITGPSPINISGGRYRINDGSFTSEAGTVNAGDQVRAEVIASSQTRTATTATITIGGVAGTFTVTTSATDTVPDSFSFTPVINAKTDSAYTSNQVIITGINAPSPISIVGGFYRLNDRSNTSVSGTVNVNDKVRVVVRSSKLANTTVVATLTVGGVATSFSVNTGGSSDTVPDSFSFAPVANASTGATYVSAPATIAGITAPSPISVAGGRYRINSGSFTNVAGTVNAGDQVYAEVVASNSAGTAATSTVTIGGVAAAFTVTTATANDTVPDSFSFAAVNNATAGTTYVSNPATITGISGPAPISVAGGRYRINSGSFTTIAGTVRAGDQVYAEAVAATSVNTATTATITIGGVSGSFTVTTSTNDTVPDSFSFTPVFNAKLSSSYVSNQVTITGINAASPISVVGGYYRLNDRSNTSTSGTVKVDDRVSVVVKSSSANSTATVVTLTIGGVSSSFTVTTVSNVPADTVPDSFSFASVNNATPSTIYVSTPATITGINGPSPISVSGGLYKINDGPATASAGTVNPNDRVSAQLTSSSQDSTAVTATVNIGGVRAPFTVATAGSTSDLPRPAEVLDFSHWKLTLPVNSSGNTSGAAAEIMPAVLVGPPGYTSEYLYTDDTGAVVFYAPTNGASTTPGEGSDNARSELRELYKVPSGPTEWTNSIGGTLTALCRVDKTPAARKQVIIGQIHGLSSILVLLVYDEGLRTVEARYYNSPGGSTSKVTLASNVKIGDRIDYRIQWIGSTLSVTVNGKTDNRQTASSWNGVKVYFKAGAYSGTGNSGNPAGDASQVAFFNLDIQH